MGRIFDIQRFCVSDGPGIRTTVFLKGCPLRCIWCHNPESQSYKTELAFYAEKCARCGACASVCPAGCHRFGERHFVAHDKCIGCGACASVCNYSALELIGREADVETVLKEVLRDRTFYAHSGGGMTLSGGEPLAQPQFSLELLRTAKKEGLHCCVETSGFGDGAVLEEVLEEMVKLADLFLFDIKETDPERHRIFTGQGNETILQNLWRIDRAGGKTVLRCPIIPGCNDRPAHYDGVADLANRLSYVTGVDLMPYHPLGISKAESLGRCYPLTDFLANDHPDVNVRLPVEKNAVASAAEQIRSRVNVPVTVR